MYNKTKKGAAARNVGGHFFVQIRQLLYLRRLIIISLKSTVYSAKTIRVILIRRMLEWSKKNL